MTPDERDSSQQLAEARKAIERDVRRLRHRWGRAREEAIEGVGRLVWIAQIRSWLLRVRGWGRGPGKPDE